MNEDAFDTESQKMEAEAGRKGIRKGWNQHGSENGVIHLQAGRGFLISKEDGNLVFRQTEFVMESKRK